MDAENTQVEIGDYIIHETIGAGSFGKVKLGENKNTGEKVAIKILKKSSFESKPDIAIKIKREIALMRLLNHPHLLKLIDVLESSKFLYIILEYAQNGQLFDFMTEGRGLSPEIAIRLFRQIIYGLDFLHSHSICHRDIKPENILLDECYNVKIADFGFAKFIKEKKSMTSCGSPHYTAPEIILGLPYDGCASDIWSCGVLFYTMLSGFLPFDGPTVRKLLNKVKVGKYVMPNLSSDFQDLISKMLQVDPKCRITLSEIKQHPAFRRGLIHEYECPVPQPLPRDLPKYDINTLSDTAIDVLKQLGLTESEIEEEVTSDDNTPVKMFCYMLESRISFDSIDWESRVLPDVPLMISPTTSFSFSLESSALSLSQNKYSLAEKAIIGLDNISEIYLNEKDIETKANDEKVMGVLQTFLTRHGFLWVFPNDFLLLTRGHEIDIIIKFISGEKSNNSVHICLFSGNDNEFDDLCENIEDELESIIL